MRKECAAAEKDTTLTALIEHLLRVELDTFRLLVQQGIKREDKR
jgi:hypothetical protein